MGSKSSTWWVAAGLFVVSVTAIAVSCAGDPNAVQCATGIFCPSGTECAAVQHVCIINKCGNGIKDPGEICDDGNITDGDGCSHDCTSLEKCGNGVIDHAAGEICDDGNNNDGDGCSHDCRSLETCGNGVTDRGEVCDDGNTVSGDGCANDCKSNESCGNGIVDIAAGEVCDDGNTADGDSCSHDCRSGEGCGIGCRREFGSRHLHQRYIHGKSNHGDQYHEGKAKQQHGDPALATAASCANFQVIWNAFHIVIAQKYTTE